MHSSTMRTTSFIGRLFGGVCQWGDVCSVGGVCPSGCVCMSAQKDVCPGDVCQGVSALGVLPLPADRQTPVKILPYPKLRLPAVTRLNRIFIHLIRMSKCQGSNCNKMSLTTNERILPITPIGTNTGK